MWTTIVSFACFFTHVLALYGIMLFVESRCGIRRELSALFSLSVIAIALYCAVIFGALQFFNLFLTILGLISLVFYLATSWRNSYSLLILIAPLFIYLMTQHFQIHHIDDLNYWGSITRFIGENNRLPHFHEAISSLYMSYTVATALLQYFFSTWPGVFYENTAFAAHTLLIVSALLVALRGQEGRDTALAFSFLFIVTFLINSIFFNSLAVDTVLAVVCAAILYEITVSEHSLHDLFKLTAILIFLSLIKEIGLILSIICLFYALILSFYSQSPLREKIKIGLLCGLQAGLLVLIRKLWLLHVKNVGYTSFFNHSKTNAIEIFQKNSSVIFHQIPHYVANLMTGAFHDHRWSNYSLLFYGLLIGLFSCLIKVNPKNNPKIRVNYPVVFCFMIFILVIYIGLIFFFQAIIFSSSVLQGSFPEAARYVSDFSAAFVFLICFLSTNNLPYKNKVFSSGMLILFSVLVLALVCSGIIR